MAFDMKCLTARNMRAPVVGVVEAGGVVVMCWRSVSAWAVGLWYYVEVRNIDSQE